MARDDAARNAISSGPRDVAKLWKCSSRRHCSLVEESIGASRMWSLLTGILPRKVIGCHLRVVHCVNAASCLLNSCVANSAVARSVDENNCMQTAIGRTTKAASVRHQQNPLTATSGRQYFLLFDHLRSKDSAVLALPAADLHQLHFRMRYLNILCGSGDREGSRILAAIVLRPQRNLEALFDHSWENVAQRPTPQLAPGLQIESRARLGKGMCPTDILGSAASADSGKCFWLAMGNRFDLVPLFWRIGACRT